jgi:Protein of unknown function (DUF4231)
MDATNPTPTERDPQVAAREARAEQYFEHDLAGQRRWYSDRASRFKTHAQVLGLAVVAAGAITAFLQVFRDVSWIPVLTALLGAMVAMAEGWRQIARYEESWAGYRLASERMKREQRLYVNGAGEYRGLVDETEAFLRFVEAIEAIVAEEQRIYWRNRTDSGSPTARASTTGQGAVTDDKQRHDTPDAGGIHRPASIGQ